MVLLIRTVLAIGKQLRHNDAMKSFVIFFITFAVGAVLAAAGEITLSVKQTEGMKYSCSLTNATQNQLYIAPFYLEEHFYAQPNCSDCATGWVASRPMAINDAKDFIPLASGGVIKFEAIGNPRLPWRISCFAATNSVHAFDKVMPDEKSHIVIRSPELPGANLPHDSN
jgi:hypothetical protein